MRKRHRYDEIQTWPVDDEGWYQGQNGFRVKIGPYASVDPSVWIGSHVSIGPHVDIDSCVLIGPRVRIGIGSWICSRAEIGPFVKICSHVRIGSGVLIGSDVRIDSFVKIGDDVKIGPRVRIDPEVTINTTPFYREGSRYCIAYCGKPGYLRSECLHLPITEWLEKAEEIAEEHDYSPEQQVEYRGYVEEAAAWMRKHRVFKEATP